MMDDKGVLCCCKVDDDLGRKETISSASTRHFSVLGKLASVKFL